MTKFVTTGTGNKHLHDSKKCPNLRGSGATNIREASEQEEEIRDCCSKCHVEIVECEFCGEEYHSNGLQSHQNHCEENPDRIGAKVPVLD
jgi:hypothetical protein